MFVDQATDGPGARAQHGVRMWIALASVAALIGATPLPSAAQQAELVSKTGDLATRWRIDDEDPTRSVPPADERNKDPLEFGYWLQDMLARAEEGYEKGDWNTAAKYYRVLADALPDAAISYSRLCHAYRELGDYSSAIPNCMRVVSMQGARVKDHLGLLQALVDRPDFTEQDKIAADQSLDHLRKHAKLHPQALPGQEPAAWTAEQEQLYRSVTEEEKKKDPKKWLELEAIRKVRAAAGEPEPEKAAGAMHLPTQIEIFNCRVGVRLGDAARLRECTQALLRYEFPRHLVFPFRWARAMAEGNRVESEAMLLEAQQYGIQGKALEAMKRDHDRAFNPEQKNPEPKSASALMAQGWVLPAGVGVAILLGLIAAFMGRRKSQLEPQRHA